MTNVSLSFPVKFPAACIACRGTASKYRKLRTVQGWNALWVRAQRYLTILVPICRPCATRRTLTSLVFVVAACAVAVGGVIGAITASRLSIPVQSVIVFGSLMWASAALSRGEQWIDYWALGVRGVRFSEEARNVTLGFRSEDIAHTVVHANEVAMPNTPILPRSTPASDARKETMTQPPRNFLARYALLLAGVVGLGVNHFFAITQNKIYPKLLVFSGLLLGLGVVSAMSPRFSRILRDPNAGTRGEQAIVGAVVLGSVIFAVCLWVFYYQTDDTSEVRRWLGFP